MEGKGDGKENRTSMCCTKTMHSLEEGPSKVGGWGGGGGGAVQMGSFISGWRPREGTRQQCKAAKTSKVKKKELRQKEEGREGEGPKTRGNAAVSLQIQAKLSRMREGDRILPDVERDPNGASIGRKRDKTCAFVLGQNNAGLGERAVQGGKGEGEGRKKTASRRSKQEMRVKRKTVGPSTGRARL